MTGGLPGGIAGLQVDPRLLMAQTMMSQGGSGAPVLSPLEGIARTLQGALGGYEGGQVRQQRLDALNQAMAALQDTSEPSQLKRFGNASTVMQAGDPYSPNPFQAAQIGLMTKPDVAVPGRDRLVSHDANGKPIVTLDQAPQTDIGQLWKEIEGYKPGTPQYNSTLSKIRKTTMEGGYDVGPAGGMTAAPGGPSDPNVVRTLEKNKEGGAGSGKLETAQPLAAASAAGAYPFELGKAGYLKNLDVWAAKNTPQLKGAAQSIVVPEPSPMPGAPVGVPGANSSMPPMTRAPTVPVASAPVSPAATSPAGGSRVLAPGMSPAAMKEQEGQGENLTAISKKIDDEANNAAEMKQRIPLMQSALQTIRTGITGPAREAASRTITEFVGPEWAKKITGIDASNATLFNSEAINLVSEMVRQLGSREAQSIYQNVGKAKPNISNPDEGNQLVMGSIDQMATRAQDKRTERDNWLADPAHNNSIAGFSNAFDTSHRPEVYASRVAPLVMPSKKTDAIAGAVYQTPKGPALWTGAGWQIGGAPTLGMGGQ